MIKLIALDMDGTVLNEDHDLSKRNIEAIQAAQAKGIEVMIATGRGYLDGMIPVEEAGLQLAFAGLNGAEVRDSRGEIISTNSLEYNELRKVMQLLDDNDIIYDIFIGDHIYTVSVENQVKIFIEFAKSMNVSNADEIEQSVQERVDQGLIIEVDSYEALIEANRDKVYKVLAVSDDLEKLAAVGEELTRLQGLAVTSSLVGNLEINSVRAQKGIALEKYATLKGISLAETMAVGDNFNDVSMMEVAGHAVAMENAPDEIKAVCDEVTRTNTEDGVALAIEKVLAKME